MSFMLAGFAGFIDDPSELPAELICIVPTKRPFFDAVRVAFEKLHDASGLGDCPLIEAGPAAQDATSLAALLRDRVVELQRDHRLRGFGDVLQATYVRPPSERRDAIAELGLPLGTYKYRLNEALELIAMDLAPRSTSRQ